MTNDNNEGSTAVAENSTWTVGELKEELDNYGDHLPVKVVVESGERERECDFSLDDGMVHDADGDLVNGIQLQVEL